MWKLVRAGQGVRPSARQRHDAETVRAEVVCHRGDVVDRVAERFVGDVGRPADPGPRDADELHAEQVGLARRRRRDLRAVARGAVEPQNGRSVGSAECGPAQPASVVETRLAELQGRIDVSDTQHRQPQHGRDPTWRP